MPALLCFACVPLIWAGLEGKEALLLHVASAGVNHLRAKDLLPRKFPHMVGKLVLESSVS